MDDYTIHNILKSGTGPDQCEAAERGVIPKHPMRLYVVGASKSGKTNLVVSLLSEDRFYKGYWPKKNIFIISPTTGIDSTYNILGLDKKTQYIEPRDALDFLDMVQRVQTISITEADQDLNKVPRLLIIFDDCLSHKRLMQSQQLLRFAIMSRHFSVSIFFLSQAYHRLGKSIRMNMSSLIYFKASSKEDETVAKDYCAPGMSYKNFISRIINPATRHKYNFLYINLEKPFEERYKHNFTTTLSF
ncbi:MAG: ATPase/DNA packaging protein [Promethearchaeota archaeon]|jgi:hypothetical protein